MKKSIISILSIILTISVLFSFASCSQEQTISADQSDDASTTSENQTDNSDDKSETEEFVPQEVTIVDFNGNSVKLMQNPKTVAIYDYAILDILHNAGFEKTGIETLIVPTKDTLPNDLSWYKNQPDSKVVTGGTLFYVDWDVLDIIQPDLVILGARSFGMNAAGERLSADDNAKFRADTEARYGGAAFARLSVNSSNSNLVADMEKNVAALMAIFPQIADELESKFNNVKTQIQEIHDKAQASQKRALFAMTPDVTSMSIFLPDSRFDMIYEEFGFLPVAGEAQEWTDQHGFDVRAEYVLEMNPDVIFLLDRSATVGTGAGADNFINDSIIAKTQAAVNKDIYVLTGDAWYTMTGGFTAVETMISDIRQYIEKLN